MPIFYTDLSLNQQCEVLQNIVEFKDFSRPLSDFLVLFKADLIFKTFQERTLNPSTFQVCANPVTLFQTPETGFLAKRSI